MNADAEWLLMQLQPIAALVGKMVVDGATQTEIDTYLETVNYTERLNAYKTARGTR